MSNWTKLAEHRVDEAIAQGEFDDLPGRGKPLDLAEYFAQPAAERAGASLLKNAGVVPPEMELLKQIGVLEEKLAQVMDEVRRAALRAEIQEKRVGFAMAMERRRAGRSGGEK